MCLSSISSLFTKHTGPGVVEKLAQLHNCKNILVDFWGKDLIKNVKLLKGVKTVIWTYV